MKRTIPLLLSALTLVLLSGCHDKAAVSAPESLNAAVEYGQHPPAPPATTADSVADPVGDMRQPDVMVHVRRGQPLALQTDGLLLTALDAAVLHEAVYSATSLADAELPPLPQGMVNMTAAAAGYRLLPSGDHFRPAAELRVAYDPDRLPMGYTPDDIYTSFYDTASLAWVRLQRIAVDTVNHEIVSLTSHFTDFINELLKAPEMPETQAFVPTAMSNLEAVSPLDGLTLIQPPTANNSGTANLSYPLAIPAGRNGMQPNLALNYSSGGGSGWLGVGWDIPVPAITLDTRWGVPRYNGSVETEIYLLNGEQLITKDGNGEPHKMPHRTNQQISRLPDGTQFYARFGDAHDSIIRHGDNPKNYWWKVVDRTGVTHYYGHYQDDSRQNQKLFPYYSEKPRNPSTLCDDNKNIARWMLTESRDLYGNTIRYYYNHAIVKNRGSEGRQIYLDSISYTGHNDTDGYYTVVFCRTGNGTSDIPVSCNNGFKEITDQLLNNVYLKCGDSIQTIWHFEMENGYSTNFKNRLVSVAKIDSVGESRSMRSLLDTICHCIQPDEDEFGTYPHIYTIQSFDTVDGIVYVPATDTIYDTTYSYDIGDCIPIEGKDSLGNLVIIDYVCDTIQHISIQSHVITYYVPQEDSAKAYTPRYEMTEHRPPVPLKKLNLSYAGTTTRFEYFDAPDPDTLFSGIYHSTFGNNATDNISAFLLTSAFRSESVTSATALGLSHTSNWSIGGTLGIGADANVAMTTRSIGGNYHYGESSSESLMTMVDIDGDGLADKVFIKDNKMRWRKQQKPINGLISFGADEEVMGAPKHFFLENNTNDNLGVQGNVSGASGSASWSESTSTTSVYFADVDGNGLIDIVDNGQVYFNHIIAGKPTFKLYQEDSSNEPTEVPTQSSFEVQPECNGIIFDGNVDSNVACIMRWITVDSLSCKDSASLYEKFKLWSKEWANDSDQIVVFKALDTSLCHDSVILPGQDTIFDWYHHRYTIYKYKGVLDCSQRNLAARGAIPNTESVRVWVAPNNGTISINSNVRLLKDESETRQQARHVDGVRFVIQHSSIYWHAGVVLLDSSVPMIIDTIDICASCWDSTYTSTQIREVQKGDILFFRLRSLNDNQFDNVWDSITVHFNGTAYSSKSSFILSDDKYFMAPETGNFTINVEQSLGGNTLSLQKGDVASDGNVEWRNIPFNPDQIRKGQALRLFVSSPTNNWSNSYLQAKITFNSDSLSEPIIFYTPGKYNIKHPDNCIWGDKRYQRLFGPLYNGWGQFGYRYPKLLADKDQIFVFGLVAPQQSDISDGSNRDRIEHQINNSRVDSASFAGKSNIDEFADEFGSQYAPLSDSSFWVEMTPDAKHYRYVSFGAKNSIGRDAMSNSVQKAWYNESAAVTNAHAVSLPPSTTHDDAVPNAASNGTPVKAIRKVSSSSNRSYNVGALSVNGAYSKGENIVEMDYLDLNGDRYPDIVGTNFVQYRQQWGGLGDRTLLRADMNGASKSRSKSIGVGFSASPVSHEKAPSQSPSKAKYTIMGDGSGGGDFSLGWNHSSAMWMDVNGDGLPDYVTDDGNVRLNTGYDFLDEGNWHFGSLHSGQSASASVSAGVPVNIVQGSIQLGGGLSRSANRTDHTMMDINGDGLPDLIWRKLFDLSISDWDDFLDPRDSVKVKFNLGNGRWSDVYELNIKDFNWSESYNESLNAGLTLGFTLFFLKATVGVNGTPYSSATNRDRMQLVDINGDGLPDLVSSDSEGEIRVRYNLGGKTNLLKSATNFTGSRIHLGYTLSMPDRDQPSRHWQLTSVATRDPLNPNGGDTSLTRFAYANPYYNRYERTSLGYGSVTTSQIDTRNGSTYRIIERNYNNRDMMKRGKLTREMTSDGNNNPYIERLYDHTYLTLDGDTLDPCEPRTYTVHEGTITRYYEGQRPAKLVTEERFVYDRYHNVIRYTDLGDTSDANDGLVVDFHYFTGLANNLIGLRKDYTVTPTGSTAAMRRARFEYDFAHGKMIRQVLYNGSDSSVYDFVYEPTYGNLDTAMQPENINGERMTYHYTYDNVVHTYPTKIVNSHGETMNTFYDYRFGKPLTVTDPTGSTMAYRYDFAGRLVSVNSPMNTSGTPSLVNQYHPMNYYQNGLNPQGYTFSASPTGHPYTVSKHYDDNGNLITETAVITDGFGQAIQTKKGLRVGSTNKMQVSGRTVVDAFGRAIEQYDPVVESSSTHRGRYNTGYDANSLTATAYDVLDRTTNVAMPLGVTTQTAYSIAGDLSGHRRFVTTTTDPNSNVTTQYTDYAGRQVQVTDALGGITRFQYDNLGQLTRSTDPEDIATIYTYDNLGRLTRRDHPDAGATEYAYDPAGNITKQITPLGEINFDYTYYRLTHKRYSHMTGNDVTYTYGTSGTETGRPVRIVDGSGMYECKYDALGNVTDETRTIALPQHSEVYQFRMLYQYDSWGRMLTMTYPDGEEIAYTYQWGGDLYAMHGNKNENARAYIGEILYNMYGQKERVTYGNATNARYTYDALHRLVNLKSYTNNGTRMQNIDYTFDNASNVTEITNNAGVVNTLGGAYENTYKYDALHRLEASHGGGTVGNYNTYLRYSPSGRLMGKHRENNSVTLSASVDMAYGYCNKYQPHAVRRMFDSKHRMLYDMRWDKAGNLSQVSIARPGDMFETGRFLFWTEDNRMHVAADDKFYSYYNYDHSGERRLKLIGRNDLLDVNADIMATYTLLNEPTLYPSAYMVLTNKGYTKHYYAGTERVAARIGGGGLDALGHDIGNEEELLGKANMLFKQSLDQVNHRKLEENDIGCIRDGELVKEELVLPIGGIPHRMQAEVMVNHEQIRYAVRSMQDDPNEGKEKDVYFYHSDHLGSASWITDGDGIPVQHLQYLPYGEPFVNQRAAGYSERFTFTGKERDEETGYSYFGARYMDHELMTMWLSVDPLSDKYPSISPYAYCVWNPIKLVDPDGREVGDYYTRDGKWVGRDKWNDKKVYICDGKDDKGNFLNAQDLKITHSEFRKKAATVYGESSAYRYSGNTIPDDLKYEMYAIASVLERNGKAYGANSQKAKDFLNKTPEKNNQNNFRVTANAAVINALLGGFDYSYGATQWDGAEQALYPVTEDAGHKDGYELHMNTMGWKISDEHYRKWSDNIGGFKAPQEKKATVGPNKGKIRLRSTAVYNSTIFWKSH